MKWQITHKVTDFLRLHWRWQSWGLDPVPSESSSCDLSWRRWMHLPHFWAGPLPCGDMPILPAFLPLPTTSRPRNSTEAVADWGEGHAHSELQAQLLILWRPENKFLQKWRKENNSVLANCSSRHICFPKRQKYNVSYLLRWYLCPKSMVIIHPIL